MLSDIYEDSTRAGRLFVLGIYVSVFGVIIHTLINSVGDTEPLGIFNRIYFGPYDMHSFTALVVFASFMVHWCATKYLYPLTRFIACSSVTVFYIYFHHILWTIGSIVFRGYGAWRLPMMGTGLVVGIIYQLNTKHGFFKLDLTSKDKAMICGLLGVQLIGMVGMAATGFWEAMILSDAGLGSDPNVNFFWLIWKGASFWMLYPMLRRTDLRAPLQMNAEVF